MDVFKKIYTEYAPHVYGFLYKLCGDGALAEELTQETFFRALKSFSGFRGDSSVFTWLVSIAKRTYYAYLKSKRRGPECIDVSEVVDSYLDASAEPMEDTAERRIALQKVRELLRELPQKYRDVVIYRVYADMSFAQIGQTLDIAENSAKVIFYRAKLMLKEKLL